MLFIFQMFSIISSVIYHHQFVIQLKRVRDISNLGMEMESFISGILLLSESVLH